MSNLNCYVCDKEIDETQAYSYQGKIYCKECYFKEHPLGPLGSQYIECPSCGKTIHMYTIKCPYCHAHIHKTGTIKARQPIGMGRIVSYGLVALLIVVIAFSLPSVSSKGSVTWLTASLGTIFSVHGLLGVFFMFLPFGIYTLEKRSLAFFMGILESIIGIYLVIWPMI